MHVQREDFHQPSEFRVYMMHGIRKGFENEVTVN